jgi:hypothetical protein
MPAEIILHQNADDIDLLEKREQLAGVRTELAERESELAQIRAQLKTFEGRYLRQVAVLYAELDDVEARIFERELDLQDSDGARRRAEEARQRAQETHDAAYGEASEAEEYEPPPSLKTLFREVAKRIHPDFGRDEAEQKYFTMLMARANQAYGRGDAETLQRLLDDHREINASVAGEGRSAELLRITRQIRHAERDIARLDAERQSLLASEVAQFQVDAEAAALEHRDLLAELATNIREQIAAARQRLELLEQPA